MPFRTSACCCPLQCDELHTKYQTNFMGKQKQLQLVQKHYNEAQKTAETNKAKFDKDKDLVEGGKKTLRTITKSKTELQQKVRRVCPVVGHSRC